MPRERLRIRRRSLRYVRNSSRSRFVRIGREGGSFNIFSTQTERPRDYRGIWLARKDSQVQSTMASNTSPLSVWKAISSPEICSSLSFASKSLPSLRL